MTSTSFNVGVEADAKNSSRVLRPPGGGHTDIFGIKETDAPIPRREDNRRNASSILEGKNVDPPQNVQNGNLPVPSKKQPEVADTKTKETLIQQDPAPRKGRVPPGGFSSGLW